MLTPRHKRRFTSTDGTGWAAQVRTAPDVILAFGGCESARVSPRTFLYFSSSRGRRRIEEFPPEWADLPDSALEALLLKAHAAPR